MSTATQFGFVLEYVDDVVEAKRFYLDVLGLTVDREHPTFIQFKDRNGGAFAIASDESLGGKREPETYWLVDDVEAALKHLPTDTEVCMPLKNLPFGKVFAVRDPAGQPQYLLEFAKQRPSQAL